VAFKIIGGIGGSIGGTMLMTLVPLAFVLRVFMILVFGLIGYLLPSVQIRVDGEQAAERHPPPAPRRRWTCDDQRGGGRAQSRELRQKRRQRAEEIAQKTPVKLLFPMLFIVMPAAFIRRARPQRHQDLAAVLRPGRRPKRSVRVRVGAIRLPA